jgi:hypothetical protein
LPTWDFPVPAGAVTLAGPGNYTVDFMSYDDHTATDRLITDTALGDLSIPASDDSDAIYDIQHDESFSLQFFVGAALVYQTPFSLDIPSDKNHVLTISSGTINATGDITMVRLIMSPRSNTAIDPGDNQPVDGNSVFFACMALTKN